MRAPVRRHALAAIATLALAGLAWALVYRGEFGRPTRQSAWVQGLYEEKSLDAARTPSPRIVIAGGSSGLFGLRADILQHELGVPVVNYATHAGLDLGYLLHRLAPALRPGDTLLFCLEYELYGREPDKVEPFLLDFLLARDPGYLASLPLPRQVGAAMRLTPDRIRKPWTDAKAAPVDAPFDLYNAPHLDGFGDTLGNNPVLKTNVARETVRTLAPIAFDVRSENLERLGAFFAWCRERGIRVIAVPPPLRDDPAYRREPFFDSWARIVAWHRERGIDYLLAPAETLYPLGEFFDTRYHLDRTASERHTRRILERLAGLVKASSPPPREPPAPASALAQLESAFEGWEPRAGIGPFEGPYPRSGLGPVTWTWGPRTTIVARPAHDAPLALRGVARATRAGQVMTVLVEGRRVGHCTFTSDVEFQSFALALPPSGLSATVTLDHSGAMPGPAGQTLLLASLVLGAPSAGVGAPARSAADCAAPEISQ